jgi:Polycystin cation channel
MKFQKYLHSSIFCLVWLIGVIVTIVKGWNFGTVKTFEWISSVGISCLAVVFLYEPLKILLVAVFHTYVRKKKSVPIRDDNFDLPSTSEIDKLRERSEHLFLMLRKSLYEPIDHQEEERLRKKMKRKFDLEELLNELLIFSAFMVTLTFLMINSRHPLSFYSSRNIENHFVNGKFSTFPFSGIIDDYDLKFYLENVFLPTIHEGKDERGNKTIDGNGWINGRMMGVTRLRQSRKTKFEAASRDFSVGWKAQKLDKFEKKFWRVANPWKFKSSSELKTLHHMGVVTSYPGGGYASQLGRTGNNSYKILDFLTDNEWIDRKTKAIFIEISLYSVDSSVFNVITLLLERTTFGNFVISHSLHTGELLVNFTDFEMLLSIFGFLVMLIAIMARSAVKMKSKAFWKSSWSFVDLIIIILSILFIALSLMRNFNVRSLIDKLESSANNEFVSFHLAAFHDDATVILSGFLISITTVRLWKILNFSNTFRAVNLTLYYATTSLLSMIFLLVVVLTAFSSAMYIINGSRSELFSTFMKTFTALMAHSLGFNRNIQHDNLMHGGKSLGILLTALLMIFVNIFLLNIFTTVVCIYNRKCNEKMKEEPQPSVTMWKFIKTKLRKLFGLLPEKELTFLHRNYTIRRANHIKLTVDAQIEFIKKYLETS